MKQQERKTSTRNKLLAAAYQLFGEQGTEGTTIAAISETAGLGFGTFYAHFDSKADIIAALRDDVGRRFVTPVDQAAGQHSDAAQLIAVWLRLMLAGLRDAPLECRYVVETMATDGRLRDAITTRLHVAILDGVKAGRFADDVAPAGMALIGGGFRGYLRMCREHKIGDETLDSNFTRAALRALGVADREARKLTAGALPTLATIVV